MYVCYFGHVRSHIHFFPSHPTPSHPIQVCSGATGDGIQMALAHTNLHWGMLAVAATPKSHTRRGSSPAMVAGTATATVAAAAVAALETKRRGSAYAPAYA